MPARRPCARCGRPLSRQRSAKRNKYCYLCDVAAKREQSDKAHERRVCALYGLRPRDYQRLFDAQGGHCPIRGCTARGASRRLSVDHDHLIGLHNREAVRGLMCKKHNRMLGDVGDDPLVFISLAEYLINPPAREVLGYDDED